MKKGRVNTNVVKSCIVIGGALLCYIAICIMLFFFYHHATPFILPTEKVDLAQVIVDSLSNSVTIATGIADAVIALVLMINRKEIPKWEIIFFAALFFGLILFNAVANRYSLSIYWVELVDGIIFLFGMFILLLFGGRVLRQAEKGWKKLRIIGNIGNKKIIAAQIFSVKKVTTATNVTYTCNSLDYFLRNGHDINGILSVSYKLPRQRDNTFNIIRDSYLTFVADGSEETEKTLINLLEAEKASLTAELQKISSSSAVTLENCCTARLLIIYTAFLKMLKHVSEKDGSGWYGGEAYIGELSMGTGELGIPPDIEHRLFTLFRTGLLGAILLGPDLRYIFSYQKDGYKTGRQYSAICLSDFADSSSNKVCLFTLNDSTRPVPQYITEAIRKEEDRIAETFIKWKEVKSDGKSS